MLKKLLVATSLSLFATTALAECKIDHLTYSEAISDVMDNQGRKGWEVRDFDRICKTLAEANAGLFITGNSDVVDGTPLAWLEIGLYDKKTEIVSLHNAQFDNRLGSKGEGANKADQLLWEMLNKSVEKLGSSAELKKALADLKKLSSSK